MAKGTVAKQQIADKIIAALKEDYAGTADKKLYFWAEENGERIQIAISMTCPKTFIGADDSSAEPATVQSAPVFDFSADTEKIDSLMERLGWK